MLIAVAVAAIVTSGPGLADDGQLDVFRSRAAELSDVVFTTQGLVHCGFRDGAQAMTVYFKMGHILGGLRDRLWPNGGPVANEAFDAAMRRFQAESDQGDAVKSSWCKDRKVAGLLKMMDDIVAGRIGN